MTPDPLPLLSSLIGSKSISDAGFLSHYLILEDDSKVITMLPADNHAAAYPLAFHKETRSVIHGNLNFFNKPLWENFPGIHLPAHATQFHFLPKHHDACLVLNLLDNCYGHSLLKMLNLLPFFEAYHESKDFCIIVPPALLAFLPTHRVSYCVVDVPFSQMNLCYDLKEVMHGIKERYSDVDIAPLNTYHTYSSRKSLIDFFQFFNSGFVPSEKNHLVYYYRRDPRRSLHLFSHRNVLLGLMKTISRYFNKNINWVILGEKDTLKFSENCIDLRCEIYTDEIEKQYAGILSESLMVVGIHGSHMILPSLLSQRVIHLVPPEKMKNIPEDTVSFSGDSWELFFANQHIPYCRMQIGAVSKYLFKKIVLSFLTSLEKEYKALPFMEKTLTSQEEFMKKTYPGFCYPKAKQWWDKREAGILRKFRIVKMLRP